MMQARPFGADQDARRPFLAELKNIRKTYDGASKSLAVEKSKFVNARPSSFYIIQ